MSLSFQYVDIYHEEIFNNNTQFVSYYNQMTLECCQEENQPKVCARAPLWYELKYNNRYWPVLDSDEPVIIP